jgi:hypothetical protein
MIGLKGEYLVVKKKRNKEIFNSGWFKNYITQSGLDLIGQMAGVNVNNDLLTTVRVGTGTSAPTVNDIELEQELASSTLDVNISGYTNENTSPFASERIISKRFIAGTFDGEELSELGLGTNNALFSRALIVDRDNNPITVPVLDDEELDVYYKVRITPEAGSRTETFLFNGNIYTVESRFAGLPTTLKGGFGFSTIPFADVYGVVVSSPFNLSTIDTLPNLVGMDTQNITAANNWVISVKPYVSASNEIVFSYVARATAGVFDEGIEGFILYTNYGTFQFKISPKLYRSENLQTFLNFKFNWSRDA